MVRAATAGIPPDQFWNLTQREFSAVMAGARERDLRRIEIAITEAWHVAAFSRAEKLPKLDHILAKIRRPRRVKMTGEQLLAAIRGANAWLGGNVIHKKQGEI